MSEALLQILWLAALKHKRNSRAKFVAGGFKADGNSIARRMEWEWVFSVHAALGNPPFPMGL